MKPILIDFPSEFETERLILRMPLPSDGKAVFESRQSSNKELLPWMPWAHQEQTEEETEESIREAYVKFLSREDLGLLVFHKETGKLIANSGLHRIDWDVRKFEIGYWIDSRFSGKGYMSEAAARISEFAFEGLMANRVEIRCDAKNIKSRAIEERLNFELEGILRKDSLDAYGKELRDTCVYARVK